MVGMIRRRLVARLSVAALLPALLASGVANGYSLYRCRHDAVARTSCCCPTSDEHGDESVPAVSSACCCDRETVTFARPATDEQRHSIDRSLAWWAPLATLAPPRPDGGSRVARSSASGIGPPLILRKRSLLR